MSTGDQSEYMRGKMAERRGRMGDATFMRDGFENFAAKNTVGVGGRMMDIQPPSGGRKNYRKVLEKYTEGGAAPDSSKAIAKHTEELANKGLRAAIKMNKKLLAGEDAEAESEEFNKLMQEWSDLVFGLPVELRKFASEGSADLSAEAAELQNRVDKMAFDQRQKARSGGRMMDIQPPSGGRSCGGRRGAGLIEDVGSFVGVLGGDLKNVAQKGIDFYNRAKPIATGVRKVLQLPAMKRILKESLGDQAATTVNSVTNFMQMVGLGKYSNDATFQKKVGSSKAYKEYASGKFSGAAKLFEKLAPGRDVNTDIKKALQEQKKRLQQLKKQYTGSGLSGGVSLIEKATNWANQAMNFYTKIAAKAPDFYQVLNAPDTEDLLRDANFEDPKIGKKIAGAIKFVFPNAGSGKPCCDDCKGGQPCNRGGGIMEDIAKAFGVPQAEAEAKMAVVKTGGRRGKGFEEDMAKFFGVPQGAQVMGSTQGQALGMVKKVGGRKPSAYAMFVKQFAAKHPGPNLMKRAGEAWRSQK